jgi:hypothetical protein
MFDDDSDSERVFVSAALILAAGDDRDKALDCAFKQNGGSSRTAACVAASAPLPTQRDCGRR